MKRRSWHEDCPVSLDDRAALQLSYLGYDRCEVRSIGDGDEFSAGHVLSRGLLHPATTDASATAPARHYTLAAFRFPAGAPPAHIPEMHPCFGEAAQRRVRPAAGWPSPLLRRAGGTPWQERRGWVGKNKEGNAPAEGHASHRRRDSRALEGKIQPLVSEPLHPV
jgi:hypothetical protein